MKKGDIVSVVTMNGEFIGKMQSEEPLILENPRMIVQAPEGKMGFARGVAMTGEENPKEARFYTVSLVVPTNDQIEEAWRTATGAIQVPKKKKVIVGGE